MADEEEPPALSSRAAPPPAAFSAGGPPPTSAFSHSTSAAAAASSDLNSRWKQYEDEMTSSKSKQEAHENYDLYETPEKLRRSASSTTRSNLSGSSRQLYSSEQPPAPSVEPRRTYSFTKSSSYDTNALIAKYAGVSGMGVPSSSSGIERTLSNASQQSSLTSSARAEALQVLQAADDRMNANANANQPFSVSRTESGGFRASMGGNARRTPSALAGLGLSSSSSPDWKSGRYSFSDPRFKEDDYLHEEEDEIVGVAESFRDEIEIQPNKTKKYRDGVFNDVAFEGDFPSKKSSWSSRYSDAPSFLDSYDRAHASEQQRSNARNMIMSTAHNVGDSVKALGGRVKASVAKSKKSTFSFKDRRSTSAGLPGSPTRPVDATGSTNLRTVWKDQMEDGEDAGIGGRSHHKTWEQVMREKKRRRTVGLSVLCALIGAIVIAVTLAQTSWRWKYKNLWGNGNTQLEVTFYALSNSPRGYGDTETQLLQDLQNLPTDADFVAHLGNLQDASVNMCPAARMQTMGALLHQAPVPVYVVPGDHDWIRCPNQLQALARWLDVFGKTKLETAAASDDDYTSSPAIASLQALEFDRPKTMPEIFSKLQHGVLVIGLHLVEGFSMEMGPEGTLVQNEKMALFVRGTLDRLQGQYRALVLLGNARPGPMQQAFFDSIADDLKEARVPTMYVHGGNTSDSKLQQQQQHYPFGQKKQKNNGLSGMLAVQAPSGNRTPLKITVGFGKHTFRIGTDDDDNAQK